MKKIFRGLLSTFLECIQGNKTELLCFMTLKWNRYRGAQAIRAICSGSRVWGWTTASWWSFTSFMSMPYPCPRDPQTHWSRTPAKSYHIKIVSHTLLTNSFFLFAFLSFPSPQRAPCRSGCPISTHPIPSHPVWSHSIPLLKEWLSIPSAVLEGCHLLLLEGKSIYKVWGRPLLACPPQTAQGTSQKRGKKDCKIQKSGGLLQNNVFWTWQGLRTHEPSAARFPA